VHRILKDVLRESPEQDDAGVPVGVAQGAHSESPSPWSKREAASSTKKRAAHEKPEHGRAPHAAASGDLHGPIPEDVLHDIADESSQSERRADEAERELMEWKKMKFMEGHLGDEFDGLIVSVTKFGMFIELADMFIEGLVPLASLTDDHYLYHENTRQIIGQRSRKTYSLGDPIRVLVDRIDRMQRRIQFAVVEERPAPKPKRKKK
jgi:ribonuclease R